MTRILVNEIGPAIRTVNRGGCMGHIPMNIPIEVNMDNAGGHGGDVVIAAYVATMLFLFNIVIKFQPPNSPETNALDVGFWMAIQAAVSKMCRKFRLHALVLVQKVREAWESFNCADGAQKLRNIVDYLRIEATNTILDNGGNDKAESVRGKKKKQYTIGYVPSVTYVEDRAKFLHDKLQNVQKPDSNAASEEGSDGGERDDDEANYEEARGEHEGDEAVYEEAWGEHEGVYVN